MVTIYLCLFQGLSAVSFVVGADVLLMVKWQVNSIVEQLNSKLEVLGSNLGHSRAKRTKKYNL